MKTQAACQALVSELSSMEGVHRVHSCHDRVASALAICGHISRELVTSSRTITAGSSHVFAAGPPGHFLSLSLPFSRSSFIYLYIYIYVYLYVSVDIYIYTHRFIHTHTHAHIHMCSERGRQPVSQIGRQRGRERERERYKNTCT